MSDRRKALGRAAVIAGSSVLALTAASPAWAGVTARSMGMKATSSSCLLDCTSSANHTIDNATDDSASGAFTDLAVNTAVAAGANAFAASASGTTTINSDTSFTVHFLTGRPALSVSQGSYSTRAELDFSFITDASGGTMTVAYQVAYARPVEGPSLDVGIGFPAPTPFLFSLLNGSNVPVSPSTSRLGTSSGTWTFTFDPNTPYGVQIAANNTRSFTSPGGFGEDSLNATFTITMPSFAPPVPEPGEWALMLAGLCLIGAAKTRRRSA